MRGAAGPHPNFRPDMSNITPCITAHLHLNQWQLTCPIAHAKGQILTGTFIPSAEASSLTSAPHFNASSTPLTVRFSSSNGLPQIPDIDPNANPRGIAIRFHLPEVDGRRKHTDIIAHSTKYFPARTGAEFLEFLKAATGNNASEAVPEFLSRHPETVRFLQDPKPSSVSFATQHYFGVNAFKLIRNGKATFVRYCIVPVAGLEYLSNQELKSKFATYLFDETSKRLETGPFMFKLLAQIAEEGDITDDATNIWPEERKNVEFGLIKVEKSLSDEESLKEQKRIIFDPIPRVDGVNVSDAPMLDIRANLYLISGEQRREAKDGKLADVEQTQEVKAAT